MTKPKYVYLVVHPDRFQVMGCFYSKKEAEDYADGAIVQKIEVYGHGSTKENSARVLSEPGHETTFTK